MIRTEPASFRPQLFPGSYQDSHQRLERAFSWFLSRAGDGFPRGQTVLKTTWKPASFLWRVSNSSMPLLLSLYPLLAALPSQESVTKSWRLANSGLHLGSLLLPVIWLFHPQFASAGSF